MKRWVFHGCIIGVFGSFMDARGALVFMGFDGCTNGFGVHGLFMDKTLGFGVQKISYNAL